MENVRLMAVPLEYIWNVGDIFFNRNGGGGCCCKRLLYNRCCVVAVDVGIGDVAPKLTSEVDSNVVESDINCGCCWCCCCYNNDDDDAQPLSY